MKNYWLQRREMVERAWWPTCEINRWLASKNEEFIVRFYDIYENVHEKAFDPDVHRSCSYSECNPDCQHYGGYENGSESWLAVYPTTSSCSWGN